MPGGYARTVEVVACADHGQSFGIIDGLKAMQHRILMAAAFLYLVIANAIWIRRDNRPPFWDMAAHASGALHVYDAFARAGPLGLVAIPLRHLTGPYPPLYHTLIAAIWAVFGKTVTV